MNTKERGDLTESIAIAELMRRGYTVSRPVGETARYDLIVDDDELLRIQCKTGWMKDGERMAFKACSTDYNASGHHANNGYDGDIDGSIVRLPHDDSLYYVSIDEAPSREMTIHFGNDPSPRQHVASEYRITEALP